MSYAIIGFGKVGQALAKAFARKAVAQVFTGGRLVKGFNHLVAENLGFSPIKLGELSEGGLLVQARGNTRGRLIFKDLVKFD